MNRPEEVWGDWSGVDEDQDLDPLIDPNAWGHVDEMTDESLADHLEQRAKMLDDRRPGPKMLREAAERLRRSTPDASEPTPEKLREWADWFDNPNESPSIAFAPPRPSSPGMLLRMIADSLEEIRVVPLYRADYPAPDEEGEQ